MGLPLDEVLQNPLPRWMAGDGPAADIVISSRARLARNLEGVPFPHLLDAGRAEQVAQRVKAAIDHINAAGKFGGLEFYFLEELSALDRQVLAEKRLISPQHAELAPGRAAAIRRDEGVSIMVNEEDHIRLQCLFPGLAIGGAWRLASEIDDWLEQRLPYAYCPRRGYLTACPTNVGTGLRVSVMMHLPALVMSGEARKLFSAITKVGLVVRGLYGEGTEAAGNIFQISNQVSLGVSEEEIIEKIRGVATQIVEQERSARQGLLRQARAKIEDRICRAYGVLSQARIISSEEAIRLWSDVKMGIDLGVLNGADSRPVNEVLVISGPGYIQRLAGRRLDATERDIRRALLIRERMRVYKSP